MGGLLLLVLAYGGLVFCALVLVGIAAVVMRDAVCRREGAGV